MKKWKLKKHKILLTFLLMFVLLLSAGCGKKEEDYRQIQVYKINGTVKMERQGNSMEAYENMQLQSGDILETVSDSYLQLKLDEDKYILLEPESKISLQATGNSIDSNTSIYLEKGAIVNQIDHPLSQNSNYQVTTPNSTMAVRGTTFRVEITYNEKGESYAKVSVYGGKVECNLVFPDGTIADPLLVQTGTEVLVWGDDTNSEYITTREVTYEELREIVIDFLKDLIKRGEELSITEEEIDVLKEAKTALEKEETKQENKQGETKELEIEEGEAAEKEKNTRRTPPPVNNSEEASTKNNSSTGNNPSPENGSSGGSKTPSEGGSSGGSKTPSEGGSSSGSNTPSAGDSSSGSKTPSEEGSSSGSNTPSAGGSSGGSNTPSEDGSSGGSNTPSAGGSSGGSNTPSAGDSSSGSNTPSAGDSSGGSNTPSAGDSSGGSNTPEGNPSEGNTSTEGNNGETNDKGTGESTTSKRTVIVKFMVGNTSFATKTIHDVAVGTSIEITEPTLKPSATPKWKVNKAEVSFPYAIAVSEGEGDLEIIFNHD